MKPQWRTRVRGFAAALALVTAFAGARAAEDRVVVLTSYPEELTARYQAAFEQRHPGKRVEIHWRRSADALAYLLAGGAQEVDVYWTPSPGNFMRLRDAGLFAQLDIDSDALPGAIAGFAIADPDGYYAAFELAGFGIAYNAGAVQRLGVAPPADWTDLADPAYAGQVQLPIPSRTGFAPALIEAVLQAHGWQRGWAVLAGIAANATFFTPEGSGSDALAGGEVAARMTIDFFTAIDIAGGAPLAFVYPPKTAFNPAHIAVFGDAPNPQTAREFAAFALSGEGQALLLHADVRRLPVRREIYDANPGLAVHPFAPGNLAYDGELTQARKGLVAALFDAALVDRHTDLVPLWRALHDAERAGRGDDPDIRRARALLTAVPVDDGEQADSALRALFARPERGPETPGPASSDARQAVVAAWAAELEERIAAARALLAGQEPIPEKQ
jgi:ABC-type Fe3+ transport system substrate-binding protein